MDFLESLNEEQRKAVLTTEGPVLVVAGPGSGKTKVIEYRVLNLINKGIQPSRILLLTFTRRAASEMLKRVALRDKKGLYVEGGTFHSFAYKLIKKYGSNFYKENKILILDESDSEELIGKILKDLNLKKEEMPQKNTLHSIFSLKINKNLKLEEVLEKYYPQFLSCLDIIEKVERLYLKRKKENNFMDFDDLLVLARNILKSREGKNISSLYDYVMVDEYQDTNFLQGEITYFLGKYIGNIMVVGDDAQSIYAFRGASHKNIMLFPAKFPNTKIIKLEKNYRSTQSILDLSNALLFNMEEKFKKNLVSAKNILGDKPLFLSFLTPEEESQWILNKIIELKGQGIALKEQAILFRSNYASIVLQTDLSKARIPFKVFGGIRFYEMSHIKDFLAFLKILINLRDEISWGRVLNLLEGVGKKTSETLINKIKKERDLKNVVNLLLRDNQKIKGIKEIKKLGIFLTEISYYTKISEVLDAVLSFYMPYFKEKFDDWPSRLEDLKILREIGCNYEDLENFLADVSVEVPENLKEERDFLNLSTIHSAKGLEWRVVFLIGLEEGILPSKWAYEKEDLDEEERLLYVAVTRAKELLFLSFNMKGNKYLGNNPTRFLLAENVKRLLCWGSGDGDIKKFEDFRENYFAENYYEDENGDEFLIQF